jgi:putative membrane protein
MTGAANLLVAFVALEHAGFLVLEMFLWTTPYGMRTSG